MTSCCKAASFCDSKVAPLCNPCELLFSDFVRTSFVSAEPSFTLSMASSEYLSARSEGNVNAKKSAFYTGIMYIVAVILLVLPYIILPSHNYIHALIAMLITVVIIIFAFTYYVSVAKDLPFKKRFLEMATISLSVAALSFLVGVLVKQFLGIDI